MELACASKCFVWADLLDDRRMGEGRIMEGRSMERLRRYWEGKS